MVLKVFKYFYYKFYCWSDYTFGKGDSPALNALLFVTSFTWMNIIAILLFIEWVTKIHCFTFFTIEKIRSIGLIASNLIVNHFFLTYKGSYIKIIREFELESKEQKARLNYFRILYIITSLASLILMVLRLILKNN